MAVRIYNGIEFKADLYTRITSNGEFELLLCNTTLGDQEHQLWQYDDSSILGDDFANGVIKPTLIATTDPGRWLLRYRYASGKKIENFSGTTNSSGNYTVVFTTAYPATPNIQANIIGGSNTDKIKITSITTTGFTVNVVNRTDTLGLLPSYANVNGASVQALVTQS